MKRASVGLIQLKGSHAFLYLKAAANRLAISMKIILSAGVGYLKTHVIHKFDHSFDKDV